MNEKNKEFAKKIVELVECLVSDEEDYRTKGIISHMRFNNIFKEILSDKDNSIEKLEKTSIFLEACYLAAVDFLDKLESEE